MSAEIATVCVSLLDEGVDMWRPVHAVRSGDAFRLVDSTPDGTHEDERWEFPPGSLVRCETRRLSGGPVLVAVARL